MDKSKIIEEIKNRYGQTQKQAERTYAEAIHQINKNNVIGNAQSALYKYLFSQNFDVSVTSSTLRTGRVRFSFDFSKFPTVNEQKAEIATRLQNLADTDMLIFEKVVDFLDDKISYRELKKFIKRRKQSTDFIRRHAIGSY